MKTKEFWCHFFNDQTNIRAWAMGMMLGSDYQNMSAQELGAMIEGARASQHVAELASDIAYWNELRIHKSVRSPRH